jgi:polysaccharide biosynthesis protein PslG
MTVHCLSALISILATVAFAGSLPDLTLPDGVGVNTHFITGHEQDLEMIAAAGFKWIRTDFVWQDTERQKGKYDWSKYDVLTANLEKHGLRAYYVLDYSSPLYEDAAISTNPITGKPENRATMSPQHPESVDAFAHWAAAAAEHFCGRGVIWEIWNEPNIFFWKPKPNAAQYTALALATAKAIRAADPQACIVAPATSGFQWNFLETVLKSGVLEYLDAVSVHPYRGKPPETADTDYARLRELISRYAPKDKNISIISGEWGYSTKTKGVSQETQAAYIVRQQLSNLLNGVPISIWYDWKNDGNDPNENEHNFGTVRSDLQPKPAYLAIQKLTHELSGYRISSRHDTGNTNDFVLTLTNKVGNTKLAAWTTAAPHTVILDSQLNLQLDGEPKYLSPAR